MNTAKHRRSEIINVVALIITFIAGSVARILQRSTGNQQIESLVSLFGGLSLLLMVSLIWQQMEKPSLQGWLNTILLVLLSLFFAFMGIVSLIDGIIELSAGLL